MFQELFKDVEIQGEVSEITFPIPPLAAVL